MNRFEGKAILVTGGASGIGAAVAARLLKEGARVTVADLQSPDAAVCAQHGEFLRFARHDVASADSWRALMAAQGQPLDVLVNCAGVMQPGDIESTTLEDFDRAMAINARGVFLGCQAAVAAFRASGRTGAIVNVASTAAVKPAQWTLAYAASKAAALSLTRTVALHCARSGYAIRCNAVLPGAVLTPLVQRLLDASPDPRAALEALVADSPIGRLVTPDEVARTVAHLASGEASGITGVAWPVDGGLTAA